MPNYSKTIIYKIVCNDINITNCYVGHTTNLMKRRGYHKSACNNEKDKTYNYKLYQYIRENGGWFNWIIIEIEQCHCKNVNEARERERYYMGLLKPALNSCIPNRTQQEWRNDNKEHLSAKTKEYRNNNKQEIAINKKEYSKKNAKRLNIKTKEYYKAHKNEVTIRKKAYHEKNKKEILEKNKIYYEEHKNEILQKNKQYRDNNKEKIKEYEKERRSIKIRCDCCDIEFIKRNLKKHQQSKKHQELVNKTS